MKNRNQTQAPKRRLQSQINVTPLIDVLLVLLVIFMVITPVTPTGLNATIPSQTPSPVPAPKPSQDSLILTVEPGGSIKLNQSKLKSTAELTMQLQDILKTRNDRTVFVQGAKNLDFDVVAQVIDVAVGSGASRIGLLTEAIR